MGPGEIVRWNRCVQTKPNLHPRENGTGEVRVDVCRYYSLSCPRPVDFAKGSNLRTPRKESFETPKNPCLLSFDACPPCFMG